MRIDNTCREPSDLANRPDNYYSEQCPTCPHSWHGLTCRHNDCQCSSSYQ